MAAALVAWRLELARGLARGRTLSCQGSREWLIALTCLPPLTTLARL